MAPKFGFFRAGFSATLLRCAALAIALLVPASPARSEVLDLYCKNDSNGNVSTLLIDTDKRTVKLTSNGSSFTFDPNAFATHVVTVSREYITWMAPSDCGVGFNPCREEGQLDRIGGTMRERVFDKFTSGSLASGAAGGSSSCRRATPKF